MRRRKAEEEKWKNVPEWKRKLLVEKEKTKREDDEVKIQVVGSHSLIVYIMGKVTPIVDRITNIAKICPHNT